MFLGKKVLPMKTVPATRQPCVPSLPGEVSGCSGASSQLSSPQPVLGLLLLLFQSEFAPS